MELELDDQTLRTRTNVSKSLVNLQGRVDNLIRLIQTRMLQESIEPEQIFHFRSRFVQHYADMFFRQKSLQLSLIVTGVVLSLFCFMENSPMTPRTLSVVAYVFAALVGVFLGFLIYTTIEQISRLISRTARLKTMIMLYLSTVVIYALIYALLLTALPDSLMNVSVDPYFPALVTLQRFLDTLYFSAICQSSIGFGDVAFKSNVGRIVTFTQSLACVAFMSILFSNWIS